MMGKYQDENFDRTYDRIRLLLKDWHNYSDPKSVLLDILTSWPSNPVAPYQTAMEPIWEVYQKWNRSFRFYEEWLIRSNDVWKAICKAIATLRNTEG